MKKKSPDRKEVPVHPRKVFSSTRLRLVFTLFWLLLAAYPCFAQGKKVSLDIKAETLDKILIRIKDASGERIIFNENQLGKITKENISFKDLQVKEAIDTVLRGTGFKCEILDGVYVIKPETRKPRVKSLTITGRVLDVNKLPLPGVSVRVKNTTVGVATDTKGNYSITIAEDETTPVLVFSFIGMETQEVSYKGENVIDVILKESATEINEIVVTGYQRINKRESTSSIVTLKAEDIMEPVGTSVDQMLQGKVAGMSVMQMTSTVGAAPKIRIRGSSTIIGNREPVWVLDGVVLSDPVKLDATELNSMDRVNLIGNAISGLNPEDIERIDVLKDASATALYGSKAANGVIVITTKRGKAGAPVVRYNSSMSFITRPTYNNLDRMNSKERIELSQEIEARGLQYHGFTPDDVGYEGALKRLWDGKINMDQFNSEVKKMKEVNTDWYNLLFRNSFSHSHTLSVSGGTEKATYYFSAGYSNQQGAQLQEDGERFNFMTNLSFTLSQRLSVNASVAASVNTIGRPTEDLYKYAYNTSRAIPAYNEDGSYHFYGVDRFTLLQATDEATLNYNVFNEIEHSGSERTTRSINTQINLDYKIASWLNANAIFSYNTSSTKAESYYDERTYRVSTYRGIPYGLDKKTLSAEDLKKLKNDICQIPYGGILNNSHDESDAYMMRLSLNANKTFNDVHSLSFSAGMEMSSNKYKGYSNEEYGYLPNRGKKFTVLENLEDWPKASKVMQAMKPVMSDNTTNFLSYYGVFSYSYMGKYIFSANIRGDGSNKLGDDARFLPIWSFSGRWNIMNESWMTPLDPVFSNLNLRASYGIQANVTDAHNPNLIMLLGKLYSNSEEYTASLQQIPNLNLEWEKTNSFNFGIDFDLFQSKISGSFEYFYKKSKDQLMDVEIESTNGGKIVKINGGDLTNKGWDLSLAFTPIRTDKFEWRVTFNTSKLYNKVSNAADRTVTYSDYLSGTILKNGSAWNSFYSYQYDGLDENDFPKFKGMKDYDENGDVIIYTREQALASALKYSGKREADISGGLSMSFRYKRLSLNTRFALSLGNKIRLNDLYVSDHNALPYPAQNISSEFVKRWQKSGDKTDIPVISDRSLTIAEMNPDNKGKIMNTTSEVADSYWQMYNKSDLRVVSGNFLRCNNISLSYALSNKLSEKLYLKGASFSFGISNPFVIKSKDLKGRDPEQVTLGSGTLPPRQTYSLMLNITF